MTHQIDRAKDREERVARSISFVDLKTQYRALQGSIEARMRAVLEHGQYIMGPEVEELEAALAARAGVRHCITVSSGSDALLIALMAMEIGPGDEVITTPFTFAATAEAVIRVGARPVFVDVEQDTCNLDVKAVEAAIGPRTRAIIPVSLYGQVADMDELNEIASRYPNIAVIEDAAQSFGATYRGRSSGGLSTIGCTSFFPSKPLGCYGDGGAIFTNEDLIAGTCRQIRVHGQSARYQHARIGIGGRMDTLQCAIVLAKLERFDWEIERRIAIGTRYAARLRGAGPALSVLDVRPDRNCVYAQFTVLVEERKRIQGVLNAAGIPTAIHYPKPLHHQPAYSAYAEHGSCPRSAVVAERVLSLPMSADLTDGDADYVSRCLLDAIAAS